MLSAYKNKKMAKNKLPLNCRLYKNIMRCNIPKDTATVEKNICWYKNILIRTNYQLQIALDNKAETELQPFE